jgi:hypothetical protein
MPKYIITLEHPATTICTYMVEAKNEGEAYQLYVKEELPEPLSTETKTDYTKETLTIKKL